jgi:cell wall-associated NlpC family hydrolase
LVFFNTRGPVSHVGLYIGNGQFVHAANPKRGVRVDSLGSSYYNNRYAGARRYKDFG